jgi:cytochrome c oxidase subunit 4
MLKRTMVTKEERWTTSTAKAAAQSNLIPDESGKGGIDLSVVVPNIEARWAKMSKEEQYGVYRQLEEIQRKDWKELSLDEKKACEYCTR